MVGTAAHYNTHVPRTPLPNSDDDRRVLAATPRGIPRAFFEEVFCRSQKHVLLKAEHTGAAHLLHAKAAALHKVCEAREVYALS